MASPLRICTSSEMRELDRLAETEYKIDAQLLMENAGRAAVNVLFEYFPDAGKQTEILVFAGKGNNAGDAFVVARRLLCLERKVRIFHLVDPSQYSGPVRKNYEILKQMKAKLIHLDTAADLESFFKSSSGPFTVIDGILGTGLKGNLEGIFYDVVEIINHQRFSQVVALDMPTGVNGDSGAVHGTSILANLTVSFGFPKLGHFFPPGAGRRGELVNVDISLPPRFRKEGDKFLLRRQPMAKLLKRRDRYGHKNSFGHTLLVGGSPGRLGAIVMAARTCHKMGTGLVTVASWKDSMDILLMKLPDETMAVPIELEGPELETYMKALKGYSSIVVGPGLGTRPDGKILMEHLLGAYKGPLVIDADGLNLISDYKD
ncbi:MAG: NAD(P)H-hydrate epimerase, partial [Bacteriovoracia bacterium]